MNRVTGFVAMVAALIATAASAETRITYKSAKSASSYYQMGVQLAEAMKETSQGEVIVTVEESQGSVQNVMEVRGRGADYVFTAPPALVRTAQEGKGAFEGKGDAKFEGIRALFPIPSLTMHFVVSDESGVESFADLEGKTLLVGKGTFGAKEAARYLDLFGLKDKVTLSDAELSNAVPALKNGQIDGFVTAGSYPAPNVLEAAAAVGVRVLSLTPEQITLTDATRIDIPAETYAGQHSEIVTTSLPVIVYATTEMDDDTAYALTKIFWGTKAQMGEEAAWWSGVNTDMVPDIETKLHAGAVRYYREIDVRLRKEQM